jgi:uncharacterized protein
MHIAVANVIRADLLLRQLSLAAAQTALVPWSGDVRAVLFDAGRRSPQVVNNIERVREILALADQMNVDELIQRFADDAVMELPFAPGKMPKRYDGLDAVRGFQEFARNSFSSFAMVVDAVWETNDPHVVVAEHHSNGVVAANGRTYQNRYVTFFTFDDAGKVTEWREYYDAGAVVRAFRP